MESRKLVAYISEVTKSFGVIRQDLTFHIFSAVSENWSLSMCSRSDDRNY